MSTKVTHHHLTRHKPSSRSPQEPMHTTQTSCRATSHGDRAAYSYNRIIQRGLGFMAKPTSLATFPYNYPYPYPKSLSPTAHSLTHTPQIFPYTTHVSKPQPCPFTSSPTRSTPATVPLCTSVRSTSRPQPHTSQHPLAAPSDPPSAPIPQPSPSSSVPLTIPIPSPPHSPTPS